MADNTANLGEYAMTGGPGRPTGSKTKATRHRAMIHECMSPEDEREIWAGLVAMASPPDPDVQAARIIMEYAYGKPRQSLEIDAGLGLQSLVFKVVPVSNESESLSDENTDETSV